MPSATRRCVCLFVLLVISLPVSVATAQGPDRERRRQFVEGLLKTLIDSQMDRRGPQPAAVRPPAPEPAELLRARQSIASFSQESGRLVTQLNQDVRTNPQLRNQLHEGLRVQAAAEVLRRDSLQAGNLAALGDRYRALDSQWRVYSHRLKQVPGLSADCRQCLTRLNQQNRTIGQLLNVQPQLDGRVVTQRLDSLIAHLHDLVEDVDIELGRQAGRKTLLVQCGNVQHQASYVATLVARRQPYETVRDEFKKFQTMWLPLAGGLRPLKNRFLERGVRRVDTVNRELLDLMWMEQPIDYHQLGHLTAELARDVDALFECVNLNVLIELPKSGNVVRAAGDFYGFCEHLALAVKQQEPLDALAADFQPLERSWAVLANCFARSTDARVVRSLKGIERTIISLRGSLRIAAPLDRVKLTEIAASLDVLTAHLETDIQRFVLLDRAYRQPFRVQVMQQTSNLHQSVHRFHESLVGQTTDDQLRERCRTIARNWKTLHDDYLVKLSLGHRQRLNNAARIGPAVVQLQTLLEP